MGCRSGRTGRSRKPVWSQDHRGFKSHSHRIRGIPLIDTMKGNFKAIICDFDGTLVGKDDTISLTVQKEISNWISEGKHFCIATGRQYIHIKDVCSILKLKSPQIVRGGSEIVDPITGKIIYSQYLDSHDLRNLIELLKINSIPFTVEQNNIVFTLTGEPTANIKGVTYKKITDLTFENVAKVVLWTDSIDERSVESFVKQNIVDKFSSLHAIKAYTPFKKAWDITSIKATKSLAILELAKLLDIQPIQMVGIGDGYNDYPLLSTCGYKIAMGNAHKELKEIADYIAPSFEKDGVSEAIKYLRKKFDI